MGSRSVGQFYNQTGAVRPAMATQFEKRLAAANTLDSILACFRFKVLSLDGGESIHWLIPLGLVN